jgi:hypothetical protein
MNATTSTSELSEPYDGPQRSYHGKRHHTANGRAESGHALDC